MRRITGYNKWRTLIAALLIGMAVTTGGCNDGGDGGDNATGVSGSAK